jgi:deoxyribonuclease-1-like protein
MRRVKFIWIIALLMGGRAFSQAGSEGFSVLSWNIRDFGPSKDSVALALIARTVGAYDAVAIQEVVANPGGAQTVARLADMLNRSGQKWDYAVSDPTRSPPYKTERYAYLWKTARLQRCTRPALLSALDSIIEREPYMLCLKYQNKPLLLFNYHARTRNNYPEVEIERLLQSLIAQSGNPLLLAGDFNTPESHPVFFSLREAGYAPALRDTPTTLRRRAPGPGQSAYLHPFDNVFVPEQFFRIVASGRIDIVALAGGVEPALRVSDHAPVWVRLAWR